MSGRWHGLCHLVGKSEIDGGDRMDRLSEGVRVGSSGVGRRDRLRVKTV